MKKTCFLMALLCLLFYSCSKNTSGNLNQPTTYKVNGITDITVSSNGYYNSSLQLDVEYIGPIQEHVSLSVSGLPGGVTYDSSQSLSGIPTFSAIMQFVNNGAAPGTYPVKLICNGSVTGQKTYDFTIKVLPCYYPLLGAYPTCQSYCASSINYADTITNTSLSGNEIRFNNFGNTGLSVIGNFDCGTNTITIPSQTIKGSTISGSGTFNGSDITIHYNLESGGVLQYCNVIMYK